MCGLVRAVLQPWYSSPRVRVYVHVSVVQLGTFVIFGLSLIRSRVLLRSSANTGHALRLVSHWRHQKGSPRTGAAAVKADKESLKICLHP